MRYSAFIALAGLLLLSGTPALAFGLTESDYAYLETQDFSRDNPVLRGLSPKELARLHAIIGDERTKGNPVAQAKNVAEALESYQGHQSWEVEHPGQLWDSPKR